MRKPILAVLLLGICSLPVLAGDVSGKWNLTTSVRGREITLRLDLKQDGESLSGTVAGPRKTYPVAKGTVDKTNHVEIVVGGDGPLAGANIAGTAENERMRVTVRTKQGESDGTAVRPE